MSFCDWQAMMLADIREQLDSHGLRQAQEYLNTKLMGDSGSVAKRLIEIDPQFHEVFALYLTVSPLASFMSV
jgi:hypothetical protein